MRGVGWWVVPKWTMKPRRSEILGYFCPTSAILHTLGRIPSTSGTRELVSEPGINGVLLRITTVTYEWGLPRGFATV
jgi:hypothetical protein